MQVSHSRLIPPTHPLLADWSRSQVAARADPRMIAVQRFFLSLWYDDVAPPFTSYFTPLVYADRLRIRRPGDNKFALGPHIDGGSVERWEDPAYRACYAPVFECRWRDLNPYDMGKRELAKMSLHETVGGCSVFRAWQGWVSVFDVGLICVLNIIRTVINVGYWSDGRNPPCPAPHEARDSVLPPPALLLSSLPFVYILRQLGTRRRLALPARCDSGTSDGVYGGAASAFGSAACDGECAEGAAWGHGDVACGYDSRVRSLYAATLKKRLC